MEASDLTICWRIQLLPVMFHCFEGFSLQKMALTTSHAPFHLFSGAQSSHVLVLQCRLAHMRSKMARRVPGTQKSAHNRFLFYDSSLAAPQLSEQLSLAAVFSGSVEVNSLDSNNRRYYDRLPFSR